MHDFYIYLVSLLFIAVVNPYSLFQIHNFLNYSCMIKLSRSNRISDNNTFKNRLLMRIYFVIVNYIEVGMLDS